MAEMNPKGSERRRFKRVPIDVNLFFKVERPPEFQMKLGKTSRQTGAVDVSEGGIGFVSDVEIPVSTELEIKFHLIFKDRENPIISVLGVVCYCRSLPQFQAYPVYRVGVEFTRIDPDDRRRITDFVNSRG